MKDEKFLDKIYKIICILENETYADGLRILDATKAALLVMVAKEPKDGDKND